MEPGGRVEEAGWSVLTRSCATSATRLECTLVGGERLSDSLAAFRVVEIMYLLGGVICMANTLVSIYLDEQLCNQPLQGAMLRPRKRHNPRSAEIPEVA